MKTLKAAAAALTLLAAAAGAHAQAWPSKTITWIVPFAAGGPTDAMARDIAARVAKEIGQQIIIENAGGAGGTIGATKAAKAAPDGYTFLVGHLGYMGAAPSIYRKLAYDPVKDFEPVFRFPDTPMVLLVPKTSQFKTAGMGGSRWMDRGRHRLRRRRRCFGTALRIGSRILPRFPWISNDWTASRWRAGAPARRCSCRAGC